MSRIDEREHLVSRMLCCFSLALGLGLAARPAHADLLLFYSFDDASDPEVAIDESGAGNDGAIGVASYTDPGLGHSGEATDRALDFLTGADGAYIDVRSAANGAFDPIVANDSATITMWVFGGTFQPQNNFVFWFAEGEADPRQLSAHIPWSDGAIYFDVNGCCDASQRIAMAEPDTTRWKDQWNHYAFVKDHETTRIYQNGQLWLEGEGKAPLSTIHTVRLGNGGGSPGNLSYNGLMDDIGVWDEALDEGQIRDVMEGGLRPPASFRRGDADGDGKVNLTDAVYTLNSLFGGGPQPGCPGAADADDNGTVSLTDAVYSLNYLFQAGNPPPAPGPESCGVDPTVDSLTACSYDPASCRG